MQNSADIHNPSFATQNSNRESVGDSFAVGHQVRLDTIDLRGSKEVPAKARNHFIKYKNGAFFLTKFLDLLKKVLAVASNSRLDVGGTFQNNPRDFSWMRTKKVF